MKKYFLTLVVSLIVVLGLTAQTSVSDSIAASSISTTFGINFSVVMTILGVGYSIIGHFFVKGKWYSVSLWLEKISFTVYTFLHWLNNKSNNGQEANEKSPNFKDILK